MGLLQRGQALADQGDWDLAAGTFARVVGSDDPALHTAALLGLAECRYRLDDEPAALQAWISATQAPENELTWRAWKALAAARVRRRTTCPARRVPTARPAAARRPPSRPSIQSRIGWLSKELGDDRAPSVPSARTRPERRGRSRWSPTASWPSPPSSACWCSFAEAAELRESCCWLDKGAMYADSEYWRLLTVALVHGSIIHLGFNMYALWIIGPIVEALYGPWRFLGIYLVCVAGRLGGQLRHLGQPGRRCQRCASSASSARCSWPTACTSRR